MYRSKSRVQAILTVTGLFGISAPIAAQDAVTVAMETSATGGMHAMAPQKLVLLPDRPANITGEPAYRGKPAYGVIRLGDAKNNQIVVVLDNPGGARPPRLYVDPSGNGDLSSVTPVVMTAQPANAPAQPGVRTAADPGDETRWSAAVPVVARYDLPGRAGNVASSLQFTLWAGDLTYNREYNRQGTITVGGRAFRVALVDQNVTGRFNDFQHGADDPPKIVLLIDRKGTGVFDLRRDMIDAAKPFRLAGGVYEVTAIDARGTLISLRRSPKAVPGMVTPADLKIGSDMIDFVAAATQGKSIHFPDDYKGKVVLLDFWATWCPPCRAEVPNIVQTYNQYHRAGFDIVGVSLDQPNSSKKLADFTYQAGMAWPQIYDGGFWKAEIAQLYDINSIPMSYLVDGNTGTILAMGDDLRGQGLQAEVTKALQRRTR